MSEEKLDKILRLLNQLNGKVDDLMNRVLNLEQGSGSASPESSAPSGEKESVKPSDVAWEQEQEEKDVTEPTGRLKCPKCGAVGDDVGKKKDKSKVLNYISGVPQYATKYYCKKCTHEWTQ